MIGPGPQRVTGSRAFGSLQQLLDLLIGIEIWSSAGRPVWQQAQRRNFRHRIYGAPVSGEASHDGQPRSPLAGLVLCRQLAHSSASSLVMWVTRFRSKKDANFSSPASCLTSVNPRPRRNIR